MIALGIFRMIKKLILNPKYSFDSQIILTVQGLFSCGMWVRLNTQIRLFSLTKGTLRGVLENLLRKMYL